MSQSCVFEWVSIMISTINLYQFRNGFKEMGRSEQFSYDGLKVLFEYLESFEDDIGEKLEFDVLALCCDFAEQTPRNIAIDYDFDLSGIHEDSDDEILEFVLDQLNDCTSVCGETDRGTIVYRQF